MFICADAIVLCDVCTFYICMTAAVYLHVLACISVQFVKACVHVFVCTGVKLTCPGSLSIRGSCAHTPWTRGEDAWSSCSQ